MLRYKIIIVFCSLTISSFGFNDTLNSKKIELAFEVNTAFFQTQIADVRPLTKLNRTPHLGIGATVKTSFKLSKRISFLAGISGFHSNYTDRFLIGGNRVTYDFEQNNNYKHIQIRVPVLTQFSTLPKMKISFFANTGLRFDFGGDYEVKMTITKKNGTSYYKEAEYTILDKNILNYRYWQTMLPLDLGVNYHLKKHIIYGSLNFQIALEGQSLINYHYYFGLSLGTLLK